MEIKKTIRVVLADDHAFVRRGIRKLLEKSPSILVVGEASTGVGALRLVQELEPDVLLLDIEMSDMDGTQVARELRRKHVPISIVILSACDDPPFIEEMLRMGVDAYLTKDESPVRIREAIQRISTKYAAVLPLLVLLLSKAGMALFQIVNSSFLAAN
jgi:two-component system, NarL family, response regulator NreC